jgi:hypothetical protein
VYRQCATVYTDYWEAYEMTSDIERFNNTLRQRVSRLVRKTLSFSKKLENHIGAIWTFIHENNSVIREKVVENDPGTILSILY